MLCTDLCTKLLSLSALCLCGAGAPIDSSFKAILRQIAAPCALQPTFSVEKKLHTLDRLAWSENFESFLANKYAAAKRFGLEGCETLIPGMKFMIDQAADQGVEQICFGMPHRGEPLWWGC